MQFSGIGWVPPPLAGQDPWETSRAPWLQMVELAEPGALRLHLGHDRNALLNLTVSMEINEEMSHHQLGRPFWVYADLPSGVAPVQTFDLRVLDWR